MLKEENQKDLSKIAEIYSIENEKFFCKKIADFYTHNIPDGNSSNITKEEFRHYIEQFVMDGIQYMIEKQKRHENKRV